MQETEPPPAGSALYSLPNVLLTPHIGWKRVPLANSTIGSDWTVSWTFSLFHMGRRWQVA